MFKLNKNINNIKLILYNRFILLTFLIIVIIENISIKSINCFKLEKLIPSEIINKEKNITTFVKITTNNINNINNDLNYKYKINNQSPITTLTTIHSLSDSEIFNRELYDQLTTNNPCLVHYCSKGRECIIDTDTNEPKCICQRYCSQRKRSICGSNGKIYENHCKLHQAACIENIPITYQRMEKCFKNDNKEYILYNKNKISKLLINNNNNNEKYNNKKSINYNINNNKTNNNNNNINKTYPIINNQKIILLSTSKESKSIIPLTQPLIKINIEKLNDNFINLPSSSSSSSLINKNNYNNLTNNINYILNDTFNNNIFNINNKQHDHKDYCSSQEYEIMKDNLLLYNHARLMSQDNNHSKDFLVSIMFSHYDQNNNANLEVDELNQISIDEHLDELSNGCILADMLNFDDTNYDGKLSINEFYQAFSKLYSVSVVSLDKALETNHLSARVGDNVEIKCDVTGSPLPPLIWCRNGIELSSLNEEDIRVFSDGSLYLTQIQLYHNGNYSCHAQRNKDVVQTHVLSVYTVPEVRVMPRIQSKRPGENAEMSCHITGDPFPKVEWLKNDEIINITLPDKYKIIGNGTSLHINNIAYSDTGAYMCQASNIGGSVRDISSLIVQEEPTPTVLIDERKFFVFHEFGIAVYEPSICRLNHQIQSTDIIPGTQEYVCGNKKNIKCSWGRAINVGTHYIYTSQPIHNRILVISIIQMVVIDVIITDKYPVNLYYVGRLDQVWLLCWHLTELLLNNTNNNNNNNNDILKTVQVIRDAGKKRKHHTVHPEPIDGQFDLVKDFFIPSNDLEQPHYSYKYGYVTHNNQRGLYKLDLANLRYTKSIDLTMYNCVPEKLDFSALYGYVIMSCREPITNRPQGQLILDYLTDSVLIMKPTLFGIPKISPDSHYLATIEHKLDGVIIIIQKITATGLEFLFDVKTTLNISDVTFYQSQSMHGYDLFASATGKEDILYLNLYTGKVEMITGVGPSMPLDLVKWNNPARLIRSSGIFGQYMVTPANNALFIINGKARTVNCEIGGILHPISIVWVHNILSSYTTVSATSAITSSLEQQNSQMHPTLELNNRNF